MTNVLSAFVRTSAKCPPTMAFTFNGIGTTFYGARDFALDGSYTTTEWFVFVYVPIIPLRSLRIRNVEGGKNFVFFASEQYAVYSKGRPNLKQVLSIYGWCAAIDWLHRHGVRAGNREVPFLPLIAVLGGGFASLDPQNTGAQARVGCTSRRLLEFSIDAKFKRVQRVAPSPRTGLGFRKNSKGNGQGHGSEQAEVKSF